MVAAVVLLIGSLCPDSFEPLLEPSLRFKGARSPLQPVDRLMRRGGFILCPLVLAATCISSRLSKFGSEDLEDLSGTLTGPVSFP